MRSENSPWYSLVFYGLEFMGRYYSSYRGFVVDNDDPKKLNRVKITSPIINHFDKEGFWAFPKGNWGSKDYGVNFLPQVGDMVWVEFEHGDLSYPIWSFASYGDNEIPLEFDSPNKYGFKTPQGTIILINDIENEEEILLKHKNLKEYISILKEKIRLEAAEITLEGDLIKLGNDGQEKSLMGDTTKAKLEEIIAEIDSLSDKVSTMNTALSTHTHPAPNTPSADYLPTSATITTGITTIKSKLTTIKTTLVDILSNKVKIDK